MKTLSFEWDANKEALNLKKHGISFMEAASVFSDDWAIVFDDPDHSDGERRFLIIGVSSRERLCIVSHCERGEDVIRIIFTRKATRKERSAYVRNRW